MTATQSIRRVHADPGANASFAEAPANEEAPELLTMARRMLRQVDLGQALLPGHLCSAGLYMLIDLFVAKRTRTPVTISGACIAGRVPATTGLRWIKTLCDDGLVRRRPDPLDRRRHLVELTDKADRLVTAWLQASEAH